MELLHDGAFAGALNVAHLNETVNGLRYLVQLRLQRAVRDMVTVAALHAQRRQADGVLQARAGIAVPGPEMLGHGPGVALTHQVYMSGDPQPVSGSITITLATVLPEPREFTDAWRGNRVNLHVEKACGRPGGQVRGQLVAGRSRWGPGIAVLTRHLFCSRASPYAAALLFVRGDAPGPECDHGAEGPVAD